MFVTNAKQWFNKIGNREMYMNCAPVSIVGGTDDKELMDSLPPVFKANIPGSCTTGESGQLLNIPNPGKFGKVNAEASPSGSGSCPAAGPPSFVESPQDGGGGSAAAPTGTPKASSSSFVTVTTSARAATSEKPKPATSSVLLSTSTATSEAAPAETSRPSWAAGMKPCKAADGNIVCFEDHTFGLCTEGWAEPMPLTKDQVCQNGEITYRFSSSAEAY